MAHEVETMAYAGAVPWHGLGTKVSNELTPTQMMEKAGVDWEVKKYTLAAEVKGRRVKVSQKALIRSSDNKVLDIVGEDWNPVQNKQAFEFFSEFVLAGDMEMHTAGSLKQGRMVWALAKIKESFDVFGGDTVESYLLFSNPHQYGKSIDVRFSPIRVVCNNTLTMAIEGQAKLGYCVSHRSEFNPDEAKEVMGLAHSKFQKYKEMAEFLGSKRVTAETLLEYYSKVFPRSGDKKIPKTPQDLSHPGRMAYNVLEKQPGAEFASGSWWQALNSVTYTTDHLQGRNAENRLWNQWFGINQKRKISAAKLAVKMAEKV